MKSEKEYYTLMLNELQGVEDNMVANMAPLEAVQCVQRAIKLCLDDFREKYSNKN